MQLQTTKKTTMYLHKTTHLDRQSHASRANTSVHACTGTHTRMHACMHARTHTHTQLLQIAVLGEYGKGLCYVTLRYVILFHVKHMEKKKQYLRDVYTETMLREQTLIRH